MDKGLRGDYGNAQKSTWPSREVDGRLPVEGGFLQINLAAG